LTSLIIEGRSSGISYYVYFDRSPVASLGVNYVKREPHIQYTIHTRTQKHIESYQLKVKAIVDDSISSPDLC